MVDRRGGIFYCCAGVDCRGKAVPRPSGRSAESPLHMIEPTANPQTEPSSGQPQLLRALGLWETSSIAVGIMIGTAIFIVPAEITREVGSPTAALAVWVVGGLLSLFGALSFAEMAAMLPHQAASTFFCARLMGHW